MKPNVHEIDTTTALTNGAIELKRTVSLWEMGCGAAQTYDQLQKAKQAIAVAEERLKAHMGD